MPQSLLDRVNCARDVKQLNVKEQYTLAEEIREYLIRTIASTGGHLASNLGVVELTIALFRVFDPPKDKIIWDVGHQSYTHKILSGRREALKTLRQHGGISGFPKSSESPCDAFDTGHSSTSISAGLGLARARDLKKEDHHVISVIGDGALSGGMAFEALNNAASMKTNFIIVLNDNKMSISRNVGGLSDYLNRIRTAKGYTSLKKKVETGLGSIPFIGGRLVKKVKLTKDTLKKLFVPGMLFEDMGITYLGPVDGHDLASLESALEGAAKIDHAVLVHVLTKKGKGYAPAEEHPENYHGVDPFDPVSGKKMSENAGPSYSKVFSEKLLELAQKDPSIVAVTAAMPDGTGLSAFAKRYPDRFFDVGIAEGHAVTFAAGMAAGGMKPVVAVYSSFLQRGFDQLVHDVGLKKLPVVFAIDRAGLVGSDGETHQGIFDLSYLTVIPGMTVLAPKNAQELEQMLEYAFGLDGPVAIRYPRGTAWTELKESCAPVETGKAERIHQGKGIALFALGSMVSTALHVSEKLRSCGMDATLVNARFAKPLDTEMINELLETHDILVTLEENVARGGIGQEVCRIAESSGRNTKIINIALPDSYVEHGDVSLLREILAIDSENIAKRILKEIPNEGKEEA